MCIRDSHKMANKKQGLHIVRGPMCTYDHRVTIAWREPSEIDNITVAGWYYRDLDSDFPDHWFTAGGLDSLRSSQACYTAMLDEITDKLE